MKFDQWTDQNGQKRSKHSVGVESMQMLDSKRDSESFSQPIMNGQTTTYEQQTPPNTYGDTGHNNTNTTYPARPSVSQVPDIPLNEEDIPF